MAIDMSDVMDYMMETAVITRIRHTDGYYDPNNFDKWVEGTETITTHSASIQTLAYQDVDGQSIDDLEKGGERLIDARRVWINDGSMGDLRPSDIWIIEGHKYKTVATDSRPASNYCKLTVSRYDNE